MPEERNTPPAIISFKKFLVGRYTGKLDMMQEATAELATYNAAEIQAFGSALEELQEEVRAAKERGTLDSLCEKYAAEVARVEKKVDFGIIEECCFERDE